MGPSMVSLLSPWDALFHGDYRILPHPLRLRRLLVLHAELGPSLDSMYHGPGLWSGWKIYSGGVVHIYKLGGC